MRNMIWRPLILASLFWAGLSCTYIVSFYRTTLGTVLRPQETESTLSLSIGASASAATPTTQVTPFTDVAETALDGGHQIWNDRPGVVIFDYDRDGDLDFYVTSRGGEPNRLYQNSGDATFTDVAAQSACAGCG